MKAFALSSTRIAVLTLALAAAFPAVAAQERIDPKLNEFVNNYKGRGQIGDGSKAPSPQDALKMFKLADGLAVDLVAAEPVVRQPLNMHFDERGRLWVVQYLQYPFPAGLKVLKYDEYLRAVFDKVPPPPPNHFKGADRITILESTRGDGVFDKAKDFVSDLNIARSVVTGRGGVWILNPPYLLFYPDKNRDDIPDGPPEVVLEGFGIEDTHSGANSLAWGPDGWLYGAHGSTCTATIKGVHFLGQAIWRYNPATKDFEVFAEGGGNTFSLEFDAEGRVFSGSNYGSTRGMHYSQGAGGVKNWAKHGPLMNPYSFGWFEHMAHKGYEPRFPQTMLIYEGGALPKYEGTVIAGMALTSRYMAATLAPDTSTFKTTDMDPMLLSEDHHFRPVDTKVGPDGAIYIADWCDSRLSHTDPRDTWDRETGRIYRLHAPGSQPAKSFDLAKLSGEELIKQFSNPNKWYRQTALRILWDRHDMSLIPKLKEMIDKERGQIALEAFWALNACGGFNDTVALKTLEHPNDFVRYWTVRLVGDTKKISTPVQTALLKQSRVEPIAENRCQIASTLKRIPAKDALPVVRELLMRNEDVNDKRVPLLLWWAIESKCGPERALVFDMLRETPLWQAPIFSKYIISRIGQRFTAERSDENLKLCAELLAMAPTPYDLDELVKGMEQGLEGNAVKNVPAELQKKVAEIWATRPQTPTLISFAMRLGNADASKAAITLVADAKKPETQRKKLVQLLAERSTTAALPVFLDLLHKEKSESFRLELLSALQRFGDDTTGRAILELHAAWTGKLRDTARTILASRPAWARQLLESVDKGATPREQVPAITLLAIQNLNDARCNELIKKHWGNLRQSSEEKEKDIAKIRKLLASGKGDAQKGHDLFKQTCAVCHTLFGEGAKIGPELTGYERDNLDFLLPSIVDPSLGIREEYTAFNVNTKDDQSLTGFIVENKPQSVTIMDTTGNKVVIPREQIQSLQASAISLMPEGLLSPFNEQQIRDLLAYVMLKK